MNPLKSLITYLRASKTELEKVTWPSREETIRYSVLVTVVCVATAAFFAALDFGFRQGLDILVTTVRPDVASQQVEQQPQQPVVPDVEPATPDGSVEAVDEAGNPTNVDVENIPIENGLDNSFQVTPSEEPADQE